METEESAKELTQIADITKEDSKSSEKINLEKPETSSEPAEDKTSDNSEYDSAGSYSDEETGKNRSRSYNEDSREHSDSGTEGSVVLEREEGDGQESLPAKKVDDDEDKKNPQYIPKRGTFYEHDDRTADDIESTEAVEAEKNEKDAKKKVWQDKKERWDHDRFIDQEQAPKSRAELISIYGYDIRNEDGPPRARRRRRYGRGPNKYTRNWEDEDAYNKPPPPTRVNNKKNVKTRRSRNEEYPALGGHNSPDSGDNSLNVDEREQNNYREAVVRGDPTPRDSTRDSNGNASTNNDAKPFHTENKPPIDDAAPYQESFSNRSDNHQTQQQQPQQRVGSGRVVKPKKEIKDSDYRGFTTKTRQVRNLRKDNKIPPPAQPQQQQRKKDDFIQSQNFTNKNNNVHELEQDMGKMNVQDNSYKGGNKHNNSRQGSVPPRLQSEQKGGSKRYSSMRQRSLPESNNPPNFPTTFYPNEYNQQSTSQASQQPLLHQPPQIHPATTQVPQMTPGPLPPLPQQVPVTAAPLLQPQFPPPFAQPSPAFLQPGVAPPPFIPPQTPQIINYVPSQPPFPPNFQGYQQQFNPVTQPTELYQPQGGITYYSTDQQVAQRPVPQKRPKAAIPIVAPPEKDASKKEGTPTPGADVPVSIENANNTTEEPLTADAQ